MGYCVSTWHNIFSSHKCVCSFVFPTISNMRASSHFYPLKSVIKRQSLNCLENTIRSDDKFFVAKNVCLPFMSGTIARFVWVVFEFNSRLKYKQKNSHFMCHKWFAFDHKQWKRGREKKNIHTFKVVSHIQNTTFHFLSFRTVSIINLYEILKNYYKIYEHYERLAYRRKMDGDQVFREISRHPFNTYATPTY